MPNKIMKKTNTFDSVLTETRQGPEIRKPLYRNLEKAFEENPKIKEKVKVVFFFTSFRFPVLLQDQDADMLEEILINSNMDNKKLILIINSPGGDALAAERIVNVCRTYSNNNFEVIVPKMAKSAATMVCFGAMKVGMSRTSELGPIDPQILIHDEKGNPSGFKAAHEVIESYNDLMKEAIKTKGRLEPYLQQLARYDARDIRGIISAQRLSESIAITSLKSGMLKKLSVSQIKRKIQPHL